MEVSSAENTEKPTRSIPSMSGKCGMRPNVQSKAARHLATILIIAGCLHPDTLWSQQSPPTTSRIQWNPHAFDGSQPTTPTVPKSSAEIRLHRPSQSVPASDNTDLNRTARFSEDQVPAGIRQMLPPGCLESWSGQSPEQPPAAGHSAPQPQSRLVANRYDLDALEALVGEQASRPVTAFASNSPPPHDPLSGLGAAGPIRAHAPASGVAEGAGAGQDAATNEDPHRALFLADRYPSALTCAKCHPRHFEEWRVSAHAYASVSPMFQRFEQTLTDLSQGTLGAFCMRCHAPVSTQEGIPRFASLLDAPAVVREGITCIACHRVVESYGKSNGHRRIEPGSIYDPIVGAGDGAGVAAAVSDAQKLKLKTDPADNGPGQAIHAGHIQFETLSRSEFCLSCHQVAVHPGIWLEVVYAQYNASPAKAKGITCQDCHMGAVPGKADGYEIDYCAVVGDKPYGTPRKHSSHMFWGPGYSIAHPGLFPIDEKGERWSPREWLRFDWQSQWGTEAFERSLNPAAEANFPSPWNNSDERRDARRVLDSKQTSLDRARAGSIAAMENAIHISPPQMNEYAAVGRPLKFQFVVTNGSEGHNLPTGSLGAQPQLWMNVALVDPQGRTVWESGYLDSKGDLADLHSIDVAEGTVPRDAQLFNLQTKFLITNVKGTDREVALPVNVDIDQIPFLRPGAVPVSVLNHPPFIRMEAHSIPALGSKTAKYTVPADRISVPGLYRLDVRMRSRVEPSYFMRFVGSTPEMINRMNHQILDIHTRSYPLVID
jgi:hypothetical protein